MPNFQIIYCNQRIDVTHLLSIIQYRTMILSLLTAGFLLFNTAHAQRNCGTVEYQQLLFQKNKLQETEQDFEKWLQERLIERKSSYQQRNEATLLTIPVVVHIIHNGETVGSGLNIPYEQIHSQIEVLNEDFRRLNDDRNNTPELFEPVAADIEIEFVLAKRDPEGLPTDGILRVDGGRDLWFLSDNFTLKSLSYWPAEDYLNIWVTDLGDQFLGYAQFPVSELQGLETSSNNALTDGVVIDFRTFGSILKFPGANLIADFSQGRTATHEIGHFLGLRHIWGDGGCTADDYCDDTPRAGRDHGNLSSCDFPGPNTCEFETPDLPDMFQNYMDYTDDVCMNLFTEDQKLRMRTVMENSPRRISLVNSKGALPPETFVHDLGIRKVLNPIMTVCGDRYIPEIEIRNYGTAAITNAQIALSVNGALIESKNITTNLNTLDITQVAFDPVTISSIGTLDLSFEIIEVNSTIDENADNNVKEQQVTIPPFGSLPLRLNFSAPPNLWTTNNLDEVFTWEIVAANNSEPGNLALGIDFFNYENEGELDLFSSPVLNFSEVTTAKLSFDVSYAKYPNIDNEGLFITVAAGCGSALSQADTVFAKFGNDLQTAGTRAGLFTPESAADWRKETIDLATYIGHEFVQINFIAKNAYGNNLYIDNITIDEVENRIIAPSPASCLANQQLMVDVVNTGNSSIANFTLVYILDGGAEQTINVNLAAPLLPGFSTQISEALPSLANGTHNIVVTINLPNQQESIILSQNFLVDDSADIIPIKESFEAFENSAWNIVNLDGDITWQINENGNSFLGIDNSNYTELNQTDWLVSPVLDFTVSQQAILNFDIAYSSLNSGNDGLMLLISTNCGESYFSSSFNLSGQDLATTNFSGTPASADWRNIQVDLSEFTNEAAIRLAFVATNRNGNPVYIDNIQIFVTDVVLNNDNILFPNPTSGPFNLAFSLDQKELVKVACYSSKGEFIFNKEFENTLNQVYNFDISHQPNGVYYIRIIGDSFSTTRRVVRHD